MISCETCREHLSEWLEQSEANAGARLNAGAPEYSGDLTHEAMTAHLHECAACARDLALLRAARDELRALPSLAAPADLRARIRAQLAEEAVSAAETASTTETVPDAARAPRVWNRWTFPLRLAWSGGLALALVVIAMLVNVRMAPLPVERDATTPAPAAPSPAPPRDSAVRTRSRVATAPATSAEAEKATPRAAPAAPRTNSRNSTPSVTRHERGAEPSFNGRRLALAETPAPHRAARTEETNPPPVAARDTGRAATREAPAEENRSTPPDAPPSNPETEANLPARANTSRRVPEPRESAPHGDNEAPAQRLFSAPTGAARPGEPQGPGGPQGSLGPQGAMREGEETSAAARPSPQTMKRDNGAEKTLHRPTVPETAPAQQEPAQPPPAQLPPDGFGVAGAARALKADVKEKPHPNPTPTKKPTSHPPKNRSTPAPLPDIADEKPQ